jgi:chemotaxis protein methyltransferase CheR
MDRIRRAEKALQEAHDELEQRVLERTAELVTVNERLQQEVEERKRAEEALGNALTEVERLQKQLEVENVYLREEIKLNHNFDTIIGDSDEIKYALFRLEQVAKTDSAVIILGETGTGKELIARALHNTSARAARPLIKVNCATLPEQFIESELFGHVKGAFTGATRDRSGRFELANGGTLFLDEIGELPNTLQGKLLRVLQDGEFEKLGDSRTIKTDARLITATNRDLEALVRAGKFRKDLWYRLNVFPITLPPLRDRKDDIPLLVKHFTKKIGKRIGKEISRIPKSVLNELVAYDWPGNVRELEHVLERSMISFSGRQLQLTERLVPGAEEAERDVMQTHSVMERKHILRVLEQTAWVIEGPRGAARILDIHPNTLRYRMKKLAIHRPGKQLK